jgi:hypothetical protein
MPASGVVSRSSRIPGGWPLGLFKLAVSVTLLGLVVRRVSLSGLETQLRQTSLPALLVPFALILASNLLGAMQWTWIVRSAGIGLGFGRLLRAYWVGLFFNNFTLGSVGGDVYKVMSVGRDAGTLGRVAGATIVDRAVGLVALCTLSLIAAVAELPRERVPTEQALLVLGFSVLVLGSATLVLDPRTGGALRRRIERLGGVAARLGRLVGYLHDYRERTRLLNGVFLLSLVIQGARVAAHFCVGLAMAWSLQPIDMGKFFLVIPILGLLIALPISIGGWGVREWAGVTLFAPLGHAGEEAVALLALTAGLGLVASLAGAVALVVPGAPARAAAA